MPFLQLAKAVALIVPLLLAMAAVAFAGLTWSIASSDHAAIEQAIAEVPAVDLGVPENRNFRVLGFREGFFPECAGLSLLIAEDRSGPPAESAIRSETILPRPGRFICDELQAVLKGEGGVGWFTYARYWHGALVVHRAVLSRTGYADLRLIVGGLIALALAGLCAAMARSFGVAIAVFVPGAILVLSDAAVAAVMPVLGVSVAALLAGAAVFVRWGAARAGHGALVVAAMVGALYNYFDFLCNPACLAMLCGWSWAAYGVRHGIARHWWGAVLVFGATLGGYGAFWAMKWALVVGYGMTGGEIYLFNGGDMSRWTPVAAGWMPGAASTAVVLEAFDRWWKVAAAVSVIVAALVWSARTRHAVPRTVVSGQAAALLVPILLGWVVIEALPGHTIAHASITFRIVALTIGLVLASLILLRQTAPDERSAAISSAP